MTQKETTVRAESELVVLIVGFYSLEEKKDFLKYFYHLTLICKSCYYPPVLLGTVMTGIIKSYVSKHTVFCSLLFYHFIVLPVSF